MNFRLITPLALLATLLASPGQTQAKQTTAADYAGTYKREIAQMPGKLSIENAGGGKIKFSLEAVSQLGGKTQKGQASGIVPLKGNVAIYQLKRGSVEYSMSMRFNGDSIFVLYDGKGFGPAPDVNPHGVYKKVQSK